MIELTKMNNEKFYLNPYLIEIVETTPDTLITTMSGRKYYVLEEPRELQRRFSAFFNKVYQQAPVGSDDPEAE